MEFIGAMYPSSGQEMPPNKEALPALAMSAAVLGLSAICILCIQIVTSTNTHTHTHRLYLSLSLSCCFSFLFFSLSSPSLSAAKTLTHVPLSTVIDIHLCVSRPTPFLPPPPLAPSTGCFSCSARMNLIAQMCVKLYFCIRRQSHISQAEQQQRSSSARHGRHGGQHQLCSQCSLWLCQLLLLWFSQPYS